MQIFTIVSDLLLLFGTLVMAFWCGLLSRRLRAPAPTDSSLADRVAALSERVASLTNAFADAERAADREAERLARITARADDRIGRMELLLAGLEDLEAEAAERTVKTQVPQCQASIHSEQPVGTAEALR